MNSIKENPDNSSIPISLVKELVGSTLAEHVEEWMNGHHEISNMSLIFLASCSDYKVFE
jgi:hypothetical protein